MVCEFNVVLKVKVYFVMINIDLIVELSMFLFVRFFSFALEEKV